MKILKNKKILFACGGTMGHINPALAVASKLCNDNEVYFISTSKEQDNKTYENISNKFKEIFYYEIKGLNRRNLFKSFKYLIININSYRKIKIKIKQLNIDIVISMGGSCGTICALAAESLGIKTIIHEQNKVLGLGNKLAIRKASQILLSYPIDENNKIVNRDYKIIGNPVESEFYDRYGNLYHDGETILIFGGSNGAYQINDFFIDNYKKFLKYKVILITGKRYYEEKKDRIKAITSPDFKIIPYTNDMIKYYLKARVVICRAGATSLSEIMALGLISICIPSPNVTANHQYHNAMHYKKLDCIEMIEESELKIEQVLVMLDKLDKKEVRQKMKQNINQYHNIYSSYLFVEEINNLIGEYNE